MSSLTVNVSAKVKKDAQNKAKKDGVTLTFVVNQALKAYNEGKLRFGLLSDDDITASFDVSTKVGRQNCIESFEALMS